MFYFVPSWYNDDRTWYDRTKPWYEGGERLQFDDSLSQMRMFQAANEDLACLVLNYMPNLRYFLHKNDLLELSYFSVFDDIQNINHPQINLLDIKDLAWPQEAEFIYTSYAVQVYRKDSLFAQIEFGEDGQLIWIDYYMEGHLTKKSVFDDRGFLSSIIYYDTKGAAIYQDYLNHEGQWQIREYLLSDDQHVMVNPQVQHRFNRDFYVAIEDLILERLLGYFKNHVPDNACFILASDKRHDNLILSLTNDRQKVILSLFQSRYDYDKDSVTLWTGSLAKADLIISDSRRLSASLQSKGLNVQQISPFDARLALGKSQHLKELILYILIDDLSWMVLEKMFLTLFDIFVENTSVKLLLVSYHHQRESLQAVKTLLMKTLATLQKADSRFEKLSFADLFEWLEVGEVEQKKRIALGTYHSEYEIIQVLANVRLIIDLGDEPDLYTQIAGISAGIPQINMAANAFVDHQKNGYIIKNTDELEQALNYFLIGLKHWNDALIYSVQKISAYTSGKLVQKIKDGLKTGGRDDG